MSGCSDDIDLEAEFISNNKHVKFIIKNKSKNSIVITHYGIMTSDGTFIKKSANEVYLKPFGVERGLMFTGDINTDIVEKSGYGCRYGTKATSTNDKKNLNSGRKAGDPVYDSADPVALLEFFRKPSSWILIFIAGGVFLFAINQNKQNQKSKTKNINANIRSKENLIEKVWNGKETMSKVFWLYCMLSVGVTSLISGLFFVSLGVISYVLPGVIIVWSNTGLWRSSTIYQNHKLKSRQSYGWATAAKVYVVLNYITTLSQFGFILSDV